MPYSGVVENFTPRRLSFEHDEQLQMVNISTFKVAGVRLAEKAKDNPEGIDPIETAIGVDGALPTEACADTEIGTHDLVWLQHLEVRSRTAAGPFSGGLR